ncbi:hypothetical protein [Pseudomonas reactans]
MAKGPVVIGFMQVVAMVRGGAGAMKVGESGLWAMIERKLLSPRKHKAHQEVGFVDAGAIRTT